MASVTGSATTTIQKLETLAKLGESHEIGKEFFFFSKGWIAIEDEDDSYFVHYTSDKDSHNRAFGATSYAASFEKGTGDLKPGPGDLTGAWKTAISLWPVRDPAEAASVHKLMRDLVHEAYDNRVKRDGLSILAAA
jgi:hypothetical protein